MEPIRFFKMSGSGNDFIIIDNRENKMAPFEKDLPGFVRKACARGMSVGADGLILIEPSTQADFKWRFFNSDGSRAEMCGNGARCAARFAFEHGVAGENMCFETIAGTVSAEILGTSVRIGMTDPRELSLDLEVEVDGHTLRASSVNTGVPHVVVKVEDTEKTDVTGLGRKIRFHRDFAPAGTNVNFIAPLDDGSLSIRTYERGVEDETLACGTGAVASAVVTAARSRAGSPISLTTRSGGRLLIHFERDGARFFHVGLEGDARIIYKGELHPEAWSYPQ